MMITTTTATECGDCGETDFPVDAHGRCEQCAAYATEGTPVVHRVNPETAPTITFTLWGREESGGYVRILDGTTLSSGRRTSWCTPHATIRRWAAAAVADGVTIVHLELRRHTRALGWYNGVSFGNGYESAPRGRRFSVVMVDRSAS